VSAVNNAPDVADPVMVGVGVVVKGIPLIAPVLRLVLLAVVNPLRVAVTVTVRVFPISAATAV
jgi:hypothetical protein